MRRTVVRGRRGPGLVGAAARTAVIAGTATAVAGRVAAAQHANAPGPAPAVPATPAPAPAAPAVPAPSVAARVPLDAEHLRRQLVALDELRQAGLLTDEEFAAKKARLFDE